MYMRQVEETENQEVSIKVNITGFCVADKVADEESLHQT